MTNRPETAVDQMAHLVGEMTEVAAAGQAAGLRLLAAELQALSHMMPGLPTPSHPPTDQEIEADFDNMPV